MRKRNKNSIVLLICSPRSPAQKKLEESWTEGHKGAAGGGLLCLPSVLSWPPTSTLFHPRQKPGQRAKLWEGAIPACPPRCPEACCDKDTMSLYSLQASVSSSKAYNKQTVGKSILQVTLSNS
jgi:hypothetical protein